MHCSREDLLALAGKWDALGACVLVKASEVRVDEAVGLFAVPKDETYDRLIINPAVINGRQCDYILQLHPHAGAWFAGLYDSVGGSREPCAQFRRLV